MDKLPFSYVANINSTNTDSVSLMNSDNLSQSSINNMGLSGRIIRRCIRFRAVISLVLSLLITISLCACSSSDETVEESEAASETTSEEVTAPLEYNIGISDMGSSINSWYLGTIEGCYKWMEENGDKYNVKFNYDVQDSLSDAQVMATNLEGMIADDKDGIILFPADDHTAVPLMQEGSQQGIKFILGDCAQITSSEDEQVWETFISYSKQGLGSAAGNLAVEYFSKLGLTSPLCLFITDSSKGDSATYRYEEFVYAVKTNFPNAEILVIEESADSTIESTELLVADFLKWDNVSERTINLVSGYSDIQVLGAYNAFVSDGRTDTGFIGIGGDRQILQYISGNNSGWLGEILQNPIELGYLTADAMYHSLVLGEELSAENILSEPLVITSDNISEINWQEWEWLE